MSKRSDFPRRDKDFYPTPYEAVVPLLEHLSTNTVFDEPCCGEFDLINHLERHGHECIAATDISFGADDDALNLLDCQGDMFITNPPWPHPGQGGDPTMSIALHLSSMAPTWLLLPADFAHNKYFNKISERCVKIVSVGRVKWFPDSKMCGKDNVAWYLFDAPNCSDTIFIGRK